MIFCFSYNANSSKLYEAWHITYMRTDSVNLSQDAISARQTESQRIIEKNIQIQQTINQAQMSSRSSWMY